MQPQAVLVSGLSLSKVTSQKIFGNIISKSETSCLQNLTQVIKVASCQQLNISKSETPCLQTQTWFTTPLSCDLEPGITKPTSRNIFVSAETKPSKSDPSSFRKLTQLTKVAHFHQIMRKYHRLIPQNWRIVTTEGLGPGWSIVRILRKPHIPDSSSRDFENLNKNLSLASQKKCDKIVSDPIRSWIMYFYILLFSYVPGLYIFSSRMW